MADQTKRAADRRRRLFAAGHMGPGEARIRQVRVLGACPCGQQGDRCLSEPVALCPMCRAERERVG